MEAPAVSVIIPVFNGAKYLQDCIGFLRAQTFTDYEVIFVIDSRCDDGTLDQTEYLESSLPRCKVIIQDKGCRQGGNRNIGLSEASGEFIWFLDVDDAPSELFLEEMTKLLKATATDFVCCNFINTGPKGTVKTRKDKTYYTQILNREAAIEYCNYGRIPVAPWNKLIRREFLTGNALEFKDVGAEDVLFTYRLLKKCHSVCLYDRPLYAYRQTPNSLCRSKTNPDLRGKEEILAYEEVAKLFSDNRSVIIHCAVMKMRSCTHMRYGSARKYIKSDEARRMYKEILNGYYEATWAFRSFTTYFMAVRAFILLIYKRNGSIGVKMNLKSPVESGQYLNENKF